MAPTTNDNVTPASFDVVAYITRIVLLAYLSPVIVLVFAIGLTAVAIGQLGTLATVAVHQIPQAVSRAPGAIVAAVIMDGVGTSMIV